MKMIEDAIRGFLWGIIRLVLIVSDWVYDRINNFINIDISILIIMWIVCIMVIIMLLITCFIRIFFLIKQNKDKNEDYIVTETIKKRIGKMLLMTVLIPTIFTISLSLPSLINHTFTPTITTKEEISPSKLILTSTAKTSISVDLDNIKTNDKVITIDTINEKIFEQQDGKYIYFAGYGEIFFCFCGGTFLMISLIEIFIQVIGRCFIQLVRLLFSFIPLSNMIDPKDNLYNEWLKMNTGDALIQIWTLIAFWIVLAIMGVNIFLSMNGIIRLAIFLIGFMSITKLGNIIAKYIHASSFVSIKKNLSKNHSYQDNDEDPDSFLDFLCGIPGLYWPILLQILK